ncbi:hypothetical protein R3P38DRAFT_3141306 [Favolaschia claudopus]|uniref:NACHT domain-containing protein n=1 Tax=Favolaschia claudopus TaxID=2862362 RepID=A0AAV9Z724_9AGAR
MKEALKALLARRSTRTPRPNPAGSQSGGNSAAVAISQDPESADDTYQKPPNTVLRPNHLKALKSGLILLLSKVEPMVEGTPAKIAFSAVNTIIDLASTVSANNDHIFALLEQVSHHVDAVSCALPETPSPEIRARINALSDCLIAESTGLESLLKRNTLKKILECDEDIAKIETAMRNINGRLNNFHIQISVLTATGVEKSNADDALLTLYNASAADATHDAGESFTRPPCHPDTRLEILAHLTTWSEDTSDSASPILWMHGPAGTGKSAIAQSFCDKLYGQKTLAGSFFFKRGHPSRGNPTKLWPTIAYQLAQMSTPYKTAIARRLRSDPALLNKSLPAQLQRLVIDPYHDVDTSDGRSLVIVIDGLDECEGDSRQEEILRSLPNLASCPMLRILIVSRPEVHIKQVFDEAALSYCWHLTVPGSYDDVRVYLTDAFENIRKTHKAMASVSCPWPDAYLISRITDESFGHFIYAATVIRFVEDKYCDPIDQLAIVTEPQPSEQDSNFVSPFPALDELYLQILSKVPVQLPLSRVLSVIAARFNSDLSIAQIGQLLGLKHEKISLTIQRLHSLIRIDKRLKISEADAQYMSVYHASFLDFLCDRNRAQNFYFNDIDQQNLAMNMLEALSQESSHSDDLHLPYDLISCLPFITTVRLTPELITLLYCIRLDLILSLNSFNFPEDVGGRFIEWLELHQAPHNLIEEWAENFFMKRFNEQCNGVLASRETPEILEFELHNIDFVRSTTSCDLIRIVQMYRLGSLHFSSLLMCPCSGIQTVREIQQLSDKDVRSIISAAQPMLENNDKRAWDLFLWSLAHPTRIREVHPDPSLEVIAIWCLNEIENGKEQSFIPPSWSHILRSCPPTPDLLDILRCNQENVCSFIGGRFNEMPIDNLYHHWHNILKWLQTFPDPPIDMLEFVKNHLPADYVEDDAMWIRWKEFTGW